MIRVAAVLLGLALLMSLGCFSAPLVIPAAPVGSEEKVLGEALGSSTGIMLLGFIPINQNNHFQVAYDHALQQQPRAT